MSNLWAYLREMNEAGVLWLDHDVAGDPDDLAAMSQAVVAGPDRLLTGMVKLWPESTSRPEWIWSHRPGVLGSPVATQDPGTGVAYVSTGFLWTPATLLDLAFPAHDGWQWNEVDVGLSEIALTHGIEAATVRDCRPKHLHFQPAHHWEPS